MAGLVVEKRMVRFSSCLSSTDAPPPPRVAIVTRLVWEGVETLVGVGVTLPLVSFRVWKGGEGPEGGVGTPPLPRRGSRTPPPPSLSFPHKPDRDPHGAPVRGRPRPHRGRDPGGLEPTARTSAPGATTLVRKRFNQPPSPPVKLSSTWKSSLGKLSADDFPRKAPSSFW